MSGKRIDVERKYSIGEAAAIVGVKEHTVRFWTSKFSHIRFMVGLGKHRYYKLSALKQMQEIRYLMKERRLSISDIVALLPPGSDDKRKSPVLLFDIRPDVFSGEGASLFTPDAEISTNDVYKSSKGGVEPFLLQNSSTTGATAMPSRVVNSGVVSSSSGECFGSTTHSVFPIGFARGATSAPVASGGAGSPAPIVRPKFSPLASSAGLVADFGITHNVRLANESSTSTKQGAATLSDFDIAELYRTLEAIDSLLGGSA